MGRGWNSCSVTRNSQFPGKHAAGTNSGWQRQNPWLRVVLELLPQPKVLFKSGNNLSNPSFLLIYSILIPEKPNSLCVFDTATLVGVVSRGVGEKKTGGKMGGIAFWEMAELDRGGGGNQFLLL